MSFARDLKQLNKKARCSVGELARAADVDEKHVRKLMAGSAKNPGRGIIIRLGQGLLDLSGDITRDDVDRLLKSAGKGPLRWERLRIISA